jgi:hypothetical protein
LPCTDGIQITKQVRDYVKIEESKVSRLTSIDDMLNKAFLLAYFIHGNKETAVRIVSGAISKLDVASTAQGKRFYYQPSGRSLWPGSRSIGFRSKVTFNELHLLQRLVYIESEVHEKQKEQAGSGPGLGKEDMIIHFIKHLVRITLKRNSFYVTLGMSRLLYNYTTQETMGIYNVVVQDPERVKDDYYYRSRKGVLMQEIKERFGDLVRISHGPRGEERFQAEPESGCYAQLVRECLSFFTPWSTPCLVPAGFDPITDSIPSLIFGGSAKEDQIEVNRIHAALHPNCYERLIKALGFHLPDQRLEVPHFFLSSSNSDRNEDRRDRGQTQELGIEDLQSIKDNLGELAERRRRASTGLLRIMADGVLYQTLDLKRERRVRLDLNQEPELIEIWTSDETGDLLLASHLMTYRQPDTAEPLHASIFLDDRQRVSIIVSPSIDVSGAVVEISYEELSPNQATVFRRPLEVLAAGQRLFARHQSGFSALGHSKLIPALTLLLLFILTGAVARYIQRPDPSQPQMANNHRTQSSAAAEGNLTAGQPADPNTTPAATGSQKNSVDKQSASKETQSAPRFIRKPTGSFGRPSPSLTQTQRPATSPTSVGRQMTAENVSPQREATRGTTPGDAGVPLLNVKRVYVESGEEASTQILREMLVRQLQLSGRFILSKTRDEADALFKVSMRPIRSNLGKLRTESLSVIVLVNARGDVIWPIKEGNSRGRYVGISPEQVRAQVLK